MCVCVCGVWCVCVCVYLACKMHICFSHADEGGGSPLSGDFCKRLGTFLGPRLAQISAEITETREKNKSKDPKVA